MGEDRLLIQTESFVLNYKGLVSMHMTCSACLVGGFSALLMTSASAEVGSVSDKCPNSSPLLHDKMVLGGKVTCWLAEPSSGLKAGVGVVDITPEKFPVQLAGPPSKELATSIDTRLYVKALVFASGEQKIVIVTLDSYKYELAQANKARQKIAAATGIPVSNIIIAASETHRAPFWNYYPDQLSTPITQAVVRATGDLGPVTLAAAKGEAAGVIENRRVVKNGTTWGRWELPRSQQDSYPAEGPFDPTFSVLAIVGADKRYKALLYNYGCKGSNTRKIVVSADFPGDTQQYIRNRLGYDVPALFLNGPSGDVDPKAQDLAYAVKPQQFMGDTLGEAIVETLPRAEKIAHPSLKLETIDLQMPAREKPVFPQADIELKWPGQYQHFLASFNAQMKIRQPDYQFSITGLSIGNEFAIVTSPGELFSKFGIEIKAQSPFKYTMVAVDANGSYGYLPTEAAFAGGGYETWFGVGSYLTTRAGNLNKTYILKILADLRKPAKK